MCLATTLSSVWLSGGQPTGKIALTMDLRSSEVASASKKICTSCPASASKRPGAKRKGALVGSSGPHALFIMILSFFGGACTWACVAPSAKSGKLASRERSERRIMFPPMKGKLAGGLAAIYIIAITDSQAKVDFQIFIFRKMVSYGSRPCVFGNELNDSCSILAERATSRRAVGWSDID